MKKHYYQDYLVKLTSEGNTLFDYILDNNLDEAEIVQMHKEKEYMEDREYITEYRIIFKIPFKQAE